MSKRSTTAATVMLALAAYVASCGSDGEPATPGGPSGGAAGSEADASSDAAAGAAGAPSGCGSDDECRQRVTSTEPSGCVVARCDVGLGTCSFVAADLDGDGRRTSQCAAEGIGVSLGDDCDDADDLTFPGSWDGPAVPGDTTRPERCDGEDNDCSGAPDDAKTPSGATCACDPTDELPCNELEDGTPIQFPGGTPKGSCLAGKRRCTAGGWGSCEGAIAPKVSDDCSKISDDDCDGTISCSCNNGDTQQCGSDVGACSPGTRTCAGGAWGGCTGGVGPKSVDGCGQADDETCDGVAHNGAVPNATCRCVSGTSSTCGTAHAAKGLCASETVSCGTDGKWSVCPLAAGELPEQCDLARVDEDCDGQPNDGCSCTNGSTRNCTGSSGCILEQTCIAGAWNPAQCQAPAKLCPPLYAVSGTSCHYETSAPDLFVSADQQVEGDVITSWTAPGTPTYGGTACISMKFLDENGACKNDSSAALIIRWNDNSQQTVKQSDFAASNVVTKCGMTGYTLLKGLDWTDADGGLCSRRISERRYVIDLAQRCSCVSAPAGQSCF